MDRSDVELMLAAREGDDEAYSTLVERHWPGVVQFFYRLSWDRDEAQDWAQEVFCRIYAARTEYRPTAQFTTYLFRVAKNHWIDGCRKRARRPRQVSLDFPSGDPGNPGSVRDQIAGNSPSPSDEVRRGEVIRVVREALDLLPEEQRIVFELSEDRGLKYREIAEILEIPVGTVKSRMFAAMARLRDLLKGRFSGA